MKAAFLAVAAAMASGALGNHHAARRHAHQALHLEKKDMMVTTPLTAEATCCTAVCTTIWTTITGEGSLVIPPPSSTPAPSSQSTQAPAPTSSSLPPVVPTPMATTCPTPGVYTIPATTVTLTESTTVCAATSTSVPAGTHTVGGVTTVVKTATTVVCPYATTTTAAGVVTSTILTTTYVCPSAGTYTIAPMTTTCSKSTVVVYPTPASYSAGTYTQAEVVTTVTETDYVVFCPFTSPAAKPTSTYVAPPPAVTTHAAPAPASTSAYVAPAPATSQSGQTTSNKIGTSGNQWAITYTAYTDNGGCKGATQVLTDIAQIALAGFKAVRVYSTDCGQLEHIGTACEISGLKMILGVFISSTGVSGAQQQVTDIMSWGKWSLVELIVVGNEAIFNGYASASELATFISSSASSFKSSGYTGPVTTTEPLNVLQENISLLCDVIDVVGANIHPFFNSAVDASSAGSFVASQLQIVDGLCAGKYGVNLETGWPSSGQCNGAACPGTSEQATAVKSITDAAGGKSAMFSFKDDLWKGLGAFDCEQSWGVIHLF